MPRWLHQGWEWRLRLAVAWLTVGLSGCAATAVRTPTPAAHIRFQDLELAPTPPGVRYYGMVFGSQTTPEIPRFCHTWASVIQVTERGEGQPPVIETHTISWQPATLKVRLWRCRVEPGVNLDLYATIDLVTKQHQHVSVWGPYELHAGLYRKFLIQKEFMESGEVGYQAIDTIGEAGRTGKGCDCIHAITDMDSQLGRSSYPLRRIGNKASEYIVGIVMERGAFIHPEVTHDWLIGALGLEGCVKQRQYCPDCK